MDHLAEKKKKKMALLDHLKPKEKVDGFVFKLDKENECYECRGAVMYDDENDEMPEPKLWKAAKKLAKKLKAEGASYADYEHSEKGWVEVTF